MEKSKLTLLITGLVMVVIIALGYFLGVKPQLDKRDDALTELESVQAQNARYEATIAAMKAEEGNRDAYEITLAELRKSMPTNLDYSRFLGELHTYAEGSDVTITSITTGSPQNYVPPAGDDSEKKKADADKAASDDETSGSDASEQAGNASGGGDAGEASTTGGEAKPAINADNLVQVPVQVLLTGLKSDAMTFVDWLQSGPRLYLINGMTTTVSEAPEGEAGERPAPPSDDEDEDEQNDPFVEVTVSGFIYVLISEVE